MAATDGDNKKKPASDDRKSATYKMGTIYVQGVQNEEEPVSLEEYAELEDDSDEADAESKLKGGGSKSANVEPGSNMDEDKFLDNMDWDESRDWALGD